MMTPLEERRGAADTHQTALALAGFSLGLAGYSATKSAVDRLTRVAAPHRILGRMSADRIGDELHRACAVRPRTWAWSG